MVLETSISFLSVRFPELRSAHLKFSLRPAERQCPHAFECDPARDPSEVPRQSAELDGTVGRGAMKVQPQDLMKPDLISKIVLIGSTALLLVSLLLCVMTARALG